MGRPNIILIMSDEHDPHISGCGGNEFVATPHLDRIAAEGARFDSAYCNSPLCVPSRFSFWSGRYAHSVNAFDNGSPFPSSVAGGAARACRPRLGSRGGGRRCTG